MEEKINISTNVVNKADAPQGSLEGKKGKAFAYEPTSIAAFQATNDLLARGVSLYRATEPFDGFGAGTIILPGNPALANELVNGYALDLVALRNIPGAVVPMAEQRIAVYGDEGVEHALKTLGFEFDPVGRSDLNAGIIEDDDVFVNYDLTWGRLDAPGQASFSDWFDAGGNYIGLGYRGRPIDFAKDAGWTAVDYSFDAGNAILKIDYNPDDTVAVGFQEDGYAFVYRSVWFTDWPDMKVSARIEDGDFLLAGFWEDWQTSGAQGMLVVVHDTDQEADVVLIGVDNTFRGHPENTFRLLGNAIFSGLD